MSFTIRRNHRSLNDGSTSDETSAPKQIVLGKQNSGKHRSTLELTGVHNMSQASSGRFSDLFSVLNSSAIFQFYFQIGRAYV